MKHFIPIISIFIVTLSSCMFKNGEYINDNPVEEIAEGIIHQQLGVDVDLTPGSPETPSK